MRFIRALLPLLPGEIGVVLVLRVARTGTPAYSRVSGGCLAAHHVLMASSAARAHHHLSALARADLALDDLGAELSAALGGVVPA